MLPPPPPTSIEQPARDLVQVTSRLEWVWFGVAPRRHRSVTQRDECLFFALSDHTLRSSRTDQRRLYYADHDKAATNEVWLAVQGESHAGDVAMRLHECARRGCSFRWIYERATGELVQPPVVSLHMHGEVPAAPSSPTTSVLVDLVSSPRPATARHRPSQRGSRRGRCTIV